MNNDKLAPQQAEQMMEPLFFTLTNIFEFVGHEKPEAEELAKQLQAVILQIAIAQVVASLPKEKNDQVMAWMAEEKPLDEIMEYVGENADMENVEKAFKTAAEMVVSSYFEDMDTQLTTQQKQTISLFLAGLETINKDNHDRESN